MKAIITFSALLVLLFVQTLSGKILDVHKFQQNVSPWNTQTLGTCYGCTIGSDGCAVTCIAMLLKSNGVNVDPGKLNTWLLQNNGYATNSTPGCPGQCLMKWAVAANYPGSSMTWPNASVSFNLSNVKKEIDMGNPVILQTKSGSLLHFVVIKGYNNQGTNVGDYIVLDPLCSPEKSLSGYSLDGVRIYRNVLRNLTVTFPVGGETLQIGVDYTVRWTSSQISGNVKIELYKGTSMVRQLAANHPNSGLINFNPPADLPEGNDYRIAVATLDGLVHDFSDKYFTISRATTRNIKVTYPNGGENFTIGQDYQVKWQSTGITGNVKIELYKGSSMVRQLAANHPNSGFINFIPPADLPEGNDYRIAVATLDGLVHDFSDNYFTISRATARSIKVTYPNGGENLTIGQDYQVKWQSTGITGNVKIELYKGSSMVRQLAANHPNSGLINFNPPADFPEGNDYRIAIATLDGNVHDFSDNYFSIVKYISANYGPGSYGFTQSGVFFISKQIVDDMKATEVYHEYWNYSLRQWLRQKMVLIDDMYMSYTFDIFSDFRDYLFKIESPNGPIWLPEAIISRVSPTDIRSNGYGGYNFFTKPVTEESKPTQIGPESYGFTKMGLFWLSSAVVEVFNGIEKVEVGFWSYKDQKWYVRTMYLADKRYWFASEDYHSGYRDYVFILHNKGEIIYLPESILDRIIQKQDVRSNNQGGSSFYTLPKEPPVDTKSAMIGSFTTSIDISGQFTSEFAIFPNPVQDKIHFRLGNRSERLAYKIFDIHGRCVQQDFNYTENQISINLKSGLYFLEIITEDKKMVEKFVVR